MYARRHDIPRAPAPRGFTLLELVAVMIILGILAAIAIGKTANVVDESKQATAQGAIAAGQTTLTQALARVMLDPGTADTAANVKIEADKSKPGGDYEISFSEPSADGTITITATKDGVSATGTWTHP